MAKEVMERTGELSTEGRVELLRTMLLGRRFEERCAEMYALQKIGGFCHLGIGQEAASVGAISTLQPDDYIFASYRDHVHALAKGSDPGRLMAELFGRETGVSRGKGGSMHFFDVANHMYGGNGIVGGHLPVATGVAFKLRYNEEQGVVLCFFGDGAIHQGAFHESLNMAKIWNLPIVYICENNQYGMGTDFRRVSSVHDLSRMGDSYGMEGRQINGMDVLEVHDATLEAVRKAREEQQPSFLEIKTYRYKGHSMSDPGKYRTREELDEYRQQDPILVLKQAMMDKGFLTETEFETMDETSRKKADEAAEFAENSPEPALETLYEDVLA